MWYDIESVLTTKMDNNISNMRSTKQRKENLITRKQDKSPEKTIRGTRGAYRGAPSTSKKEEEEERLDRPKKFLNQNKGYGLGKRPDFSLKNRNVHLASSRYGQVCVFSFNNISKKTCSLDMIFPTLSFLSTALLLKMINIFYINKINNKTPNWNWIGPEYWEILHKEVVFRTWYYDMLLLTFHGRF